jgi:hypothetical protein
VEVVRGRGIPVAAVAAAAILACAGAVCGNHVARTGSVAVTAPDSDTSTSADCAALHAKLPATLEGKYHRGSVPHSVQTAVWGSPTTVLRCGVAEPAAITVGGPDYTPTTNEYMNVNGLNWYVETLSDGARFTTTDRALYVELYVPGDTVHATDAIVDLAPVILASVPNKDQQFAEDKP